MATLVGQTVSHYRILEHLGGGGMGIVYKAQDLKLDRPVALKFLPPALTADPDAKQRFVHEARAASALQHNNICTVHDIDQTDDGQLFIVMDLYDGETLKKRIERGPLKMDEAVEIATQIAQGLSLAHQQGITHRDVKPANVMVTRDGTAKIVDFGLAKLSGATRLTRTGSTLGTIAYMSPEQLQGEQVDARGDIFSFGVMLYEMLTGTAPFHAEHEAALVYSIVNEEPEPLLTYLPSAPSELVHLVGRALEKDPRDRYQTMADVLIDLRRLGREAGRVPKSTPQRTGIAQRRARHTWGIVSGVLLCLVLPIVYFVFIHRAVPTLNPQASFQRLNMPFTSVAAVSLSKDGNWIAFLTPDARNLWSVHFMNVAKKEARKLIATTISYPWFTDISPDGSEVLYGIYGMTSQEFCVVSTVAGEGEESKVLEGPLITGRWRPDGRKIGYVRWESGTTKPEFWTSDPDGRNPSRVFRDSLYVQGMYTPEFDWSPGGESIAWLRGYGGDTCEIIVRNVASGSEKRLTASRSSIADLAWGPEDLIFFSSNKGGNYNIWAVSVQGGDAVQLSRGSGPDVGVRTSADGKRILYTEREDTDNLWTADLDGGSARQLTFDFQRLFTPVFSPDQSRICFQSWPGQLNNYCEIVIVNADGSNRRRITPAGLFSYQPSWSPDGKSIAYGWRDRGDPLGVGQISIVDAANPSTYRYRGQGMSACWIDADRIAVLKDDPAKTVLLSTNDFRVLQSFEDSTWQFPLRDGSHTLIEDFRTGREGWWLRTVASGREPTTTKLLDIQFLSRAWPSVSLNFLLYAETDGTVWRISLPGGRRERFPEILDGSNPHWFEGFQLSPDDKRIVFKKWKWEAKVMLVENVFQ